MGKGDKKSKKGKRWRASFGVTRSKNAIKAKMKRTASKKASSSAATVAAPAKAKRVVKKKADA